MGNLCQSSTGSPLYIFNFVINIHSFLSLQALDYDENNIKALFRRAQANANMHDYSSAMVRYLIPLHSNMSTLLVVLHLNTHFDFELREEKLESLEKTL